MSFKKVLAILLAVCMHIPMAACGKKENPDTDGSATTTIQQAEVTDGDGEADPTDGEGEETTVDGETEVTDENGETVTTVEGETTTTKNDGGKTTTTNNKDGKTTTTNDKGGKTTTTTKPKRTSTTKKVTTTTRSGGSTAVRAEVELKKGTTRADKNVNLGGKTFLLASPNTGSKPSEFTQGGFDIFKQKYNGIMTQDGLGTAEYVQKVAAQQAGGKVYDVLFMQMSNYPELFVADCAIPVTDYITTADLWKNATEGGFSEAVMQDYSWKGEAYAMGGSYSQVPYAVFYNKKIFKDNRLDDPETLVKNGQWTWEKFLEIGQEYVAANKDKAFVHPLVNYTPGGFLTSYNTDLVVLKNGAIKENTSDKQLYKALDMLQKMHYGASAIVEKVPSVDANSVRNSLMNGSIVTLLGSAGWHKLLSERAATSSVFGNSAANLGIVLAPRGEGSSKYGLEDCQFYVAGKGTSDVRAAICYAMVESHYNTLNSFSPTLSAQQKADIAKILDSGNLKAPLGSFVSSLGSLPRLAMIGQAAQGVPVSTVLSTYKKQIQRVVDQACK